MNDQQPAIMRITTAITPSIEYLRLGTLLIEALSSNGLVKFVNINTDGGVHRDGLPHVYYMSLNDHPSQAELMRERHKFPRERYVIDVTGPSLWPDRLDMTVNSEEIYEKISSQEVQEIYKEVIWLADVVTVNHPSHAEMIEPLNKNIFILPDINESKEEDESRFVQDFIRMMTLASMQSIDVEVKK